MSGRSLGGVAATDRHVIASGRALADSADLWVCLDADTGNSLWTLRYPAPGALDYGNSPRATPLIDGDVAFLFGAIGHLHAVDLATGKVVWKKDTRAEFGVTEELAWGHCGSPLIAGGKLILYAGGTRAGIVALEPRTGAVVWSTPGGPPGYGSLLAGTFGGVHQVVGHDATDLHGWDVATGRKLWTVTPPRPKDFNVPTPLAWNGYLVVVTENNGTRLFRFRDGGAIDPNPVAVNTALAPDTHTPVVVGDRLFGVHDGLVCLDLANGLKTRWEHRDAELQIHATAVATAERVLVLTLTAEALLIDARAVDFRLLDRRRLLPDETEMYAHPAVAGRRVYLRAADSVYCVGLEPKTN